MPTLKKKLQLMWNFFQGFMDFFPILVLFANANFYYKLRRQEDPNNRSWITLVLYTVRVDVKSSLADVIVSFTSNFILFFKRGPILGHLF